jgi:hypothetical protein
MGDKLHFFTSYPMRIFIRANKGSMGSKRSAWAICYVFNLLTQPKANRFAFNK